MIKKTSLFAALILGAAALVRAQSVAGPQSAGAAAPAAVLGAVSIEEAQALKTMLPTSGELPLIVPTLLSLDVNAPEQRALLAPLKAAQAAGKTSLSDVLAAATQSVSAQRKSAMDAAGGQDASLAQVESAVSQLGQLRRLVALYEPEAGLQLESALLSAEKRAAALRATEVKSSAEATAAALNQLQPEDPTAAPVTDGRVTVAQALIKELRDSADTDYQEGLIDKLQGMALETDAPEGLRRTIADAFILEMKGSADSDYSEYIVDRLEKLALASPAQQLQVVAGLMKDVHDSADSDYIDYLLNAAQNVAVASTDNGVKGLTISHLLKEIKDSADTDYSEETQGRIDKIAESAGGLANIQVPELPKPVLPVPRQPKAEIELGKQLSQGATEHPWGAFFGLLALAGTVVTLGTHSFPLLGIAFAGLLLLGVGTRGLYTDHPVAGFFQLLVIGDLFEQAASAGALGAGHWLALIIGGLAGAALADWSFKKDHPVLGFFLNLVLMWMFLAAVVGPHAAAALVSVSTN